jgi:hypothetical protein
LYVKVMLTLALGNLLVGFLNAAAGNLGMSIANALTFGFCLWNIRHRSSVAATELPGPKGIVNGKKAK